MWAAHIFPGCEFAPILLRCTYKPENLSITIRNSTMKLLLLAALIGTLVAEYPDTLEKKYRKKTRSYTWVVSRDVQVVEGRTLIVNTINGRVKGPALFVRQGEFLEVKVKNKLSDSGLSIHWHGLEMRDYQLYDGPVGLVQCPIAPGESMTYRFKIQEHPGTYWYHTHNEIFPSGHDFVRGPIVVMPKDGPAYLNHLRDPYDYTHLNERVLFYQDFYPNYIAHDHLMSMGGLRQTGGNDAEGSIALLAPWSGGALNGGENSDFMQFENGEYKFRIINGAGLAPFLWSIDGFRFKVVATDGSDVEPYEVDQIQVHLGERYDVVVTFDVDEPKNVLMRGSTTAVTNPSAVILTTLQLRPDESYEFVEGKARTSPNPDPVVMNCNYYGEQEKCISVTELKTKDFEFENRPILEDIDIHTADFYFSRSPLYAYFFSLDEKPHVQNVLPHKPIAYPDFDNEKDMTNHTNVLDLELNKTVILVLRSEGGIAHPIHLHGHKFEVLEQISRPNPNCFGPGLCPLADLDTSFSAPVSELAKRETRGVLKDVIIVPSFGAAVVRFNTDNPGVWFAHCHYDEHADSGQGFIMNEGNWKADSIPSDFPSCDNTGRLQELTGDLCNCDPEQLNGDWLCSRDYMCYHAESSAKDTGN